MHPAGGGAAPRSLAGGLTAGVQVELVRVVCALGGVATAAALDVQLELQGVAGTGLRETAVLSWWRRERGILPLSLSLRLRVPFPPPTHL